MTTSSMEKFDNPSVEAKLAGAEALELATTRDLTTRPPCHFLLEELGVPRVDDAVADLPVRHNLVDTRASRHGQGTPYAGTAVYLPFTSRS